MTSTSKGATAREYLRVSLDTSGRERSITEQQDDNRATWAEFTFTGAPYSDVSISASRYSRKARGGWAKMLDDIRAGRFSAAVLVLWESSRGSRRVGEWVELIELCEAAHVCIAVTTHNRVYDPANARDRRSLLEDAVDSEYESGKTSDRMRRAVAANAAAGRPHGKVPYGYARRYDPRTRSLVAQEIEPAEAAVVRELFDRLARGESFRAIATDYAARGIRNRSGRPFVPQHLRTLTRTEAYRGVRTYTPGRIGGDRKATAVPAQLTPAAWPAIVPEATWLAVQRLLSDPARKTTRPGSGIHLLSHIGVCDVCGGPLGVTYRASHESGRGVRRYQCQRGGHIRIDADPLDALAEAVMLGYLARPDNVERLTADDADGAALDAARLEVAKLRAELDDLADQVGHGTISATLAARAEPGILARLRVAESLADSLATPSRLRGLISPGADVARRWRALPMSARREVARILLAPDLLGQLRVTRLPYRGCEISDRVRLNRRPATN